MPGEVGGAAGAAPGPPGPAGPCGRSAVAMALQTRPARRPARPRAPSGRTVPKEMPEKQKSEDIISEPEMKPNSLRLSVSCLGSRV